MTLLKWTSLIFAALFLQTQITVFTVHPNLTAALVYAYTIVTLRDPSIINHMSSRPEAQGAAFGAVVGLIEDAVTGSIVGPAFLGKGLIGFLSALLFTDIFFRWTPVLGGIALAMLTIFERLTVSLLFILFDDITINWTHALSSILLQVLINLPFGIIIRPK